jgi:hypothetical protein
VAAAILERTRVRELTTITLTPRGGVHIWALTREPVYTGKVLAPDGSPLGDVKATSRGGGPGGYALVYGRTEHGSYALHWGPGAILVDDAAAWFEELLAAAGIPASIGRGAPHRQEGASVIPEGRRNNTLTAIAGFMRARGLNALSIFEALTVINARHCRPPLPEAEVRRIAYGMERYPPHPNRPDNGHAASGAPAETPGRGQAAPAEDRGSSVQTNIFTVGTKLLDVSDILSAPTAASLESLPLLGEPGIIIRGWSHLLAGPPKCGKSELAWACAREWDAQGLRVLWVSEETEAIWGERIRRDNASPTHMRWFIAAGRRGEDILEALRGVASGFDVVIVDTIRHLFQVDEGDNAAIARTISSLDEAIGRDKTRI